MGRAASPDIIGAIGADGVAVNRQRLGIVVVTIFGAVAPPAKADPCQGALPSAGTEFSGIVRYVGDGDGLCVGPAARPDQWIEVRLADFSAPELVEPGGREARATLSSLARNRAVLCRAGRRSYDRVVAHCRPAGKPLGDLLRARGVSEGGRGTGRSKP